MDELIERVDRALRSGYPGAPNGRVRDVPDRRAIRWYTTIGLVDRPLGMRGRTALYGHRHLRQLVAVKRLQARGLTLAQIQAQLSLVSDETLDRFAGVPPHLLADEGGATAEATGPPVRFWARRPSAEPEMAPATGAHTASAPGENPTSPSRTGPALPSRAESTPPSRADSASPAGGDAGSAGADDPGQAAGGAVARRDSTPGVPAKALTGIDLGAGVLLILPRTVPDGDLGAIAGAAAPLLTLLAARGLTDGSPS